MLTSLNNLNVAGCDGDVALSRRSVDIAAALDDDSELSDELDNLDSENEELNSINYRVLPCTKEKIKKLYQSELVR